jgi:hypothetical protein
MLNKRGIVHDNLELVIAGIALVGVLIFLTVVNTAYSSSVFNERATISVEGTAGDLVDTKYLGTDLVNIMRLDFDEYTFGELLSYINFEAKDGITSTYFYRDVFGGQNCNEETIAKLNTFLQMYEGRWLLYVEDNEGQEVVRCPLYSKPYSSFGSEMKILSADASELTVHLEVWSP